MIRVGVRVGDAGRLGLFGFLVEPSIVLAALTTTSAFVLVMMVVATKPLLAKTGVVNAIPGSWSLTLTLTQRLQRNRRLFCVCCVSCVCCVCWLCQFDCLCFHQALALSLPLTPHPPLPPPLPLHHCFESVMIRCSVYAVLPSPCECNFTYTYTHIYTRRVFFFSTYTYTHKYTRT